MVIGVYRIYQGLRGLMGFRGLGLEGGFGGGVACLICLLMLLTFQICIFMFGSVSGDSRALGRLILVLRGGGWSADRGTLAG